MAARYQMVLWNANKRAYDALLGLGVAAFLALYIGLVMTASHGRATPEQVIIEAFGACAFLMLHLVLMIGPLARLVPRVFLPLLYNRRHAGVLLFVVALVHAALALVWYHGFGIIDPFTSLLTQGAPIRTWTDIPFEWFGVFAFVVLFLMASTSHDFWLANLGASVWKALHMGVYLAYGALVLHVMLGAAQDEVGPVFAYLTGAGAGLLASLHLLAGLLEARSARAYALASGGEAWVDAGSPLEIEEGRARIISVDGDERIAVWRSQGQIFATSNVCAHQGGPLGEGRIIDGCITCPWHGYQYLPANGRSPPPFTEKIPTHRVRIEAGRIRVERAAQPPGTAVMPATFAEADHG